MHFHLYCNAITLLPQDGETHDSNFYSQAIHTSDLLASCIEKMNYSFVHGT